MKLSVAMCTFNGARFIRRQLDSILNQELPIDEIVVCDDGSADETYAIVNEIAQSNTKVQWIIQRNENLLGVTRNFEKAIGLCTGDVIFLSDQDDLWKKDKSSIIIQYFESHMEKDVVFSNADLIDAEDESFSKYTLLEAVELLQNLKLWNDGLDLEMMLCVNRVTGATMALRKSFRYECIPFDNTSYALHDEQIAIMACIRGKLGLITDCLISYRQHSNNVIGVRRAWLSSDKQKCTLDITYPRNVKVCRNVKTPKLLFYISRYERTKGGRFILCFPFMIVNYVKFYKRYWYSFMWKDIKVAGRNILNILRYCLLSDSIRQTIN